MAIAYFEMECLRVNNIMLTTRYHCKVVVYCWKIASEMNMFRVEKLYFCKEMSSYVQFAIASTRSTARVTVLEF